MSRSQLGVGVSSKSHNGVSFASRLAAALDDAQINVFDLALRTGLSHKEIRKWADSLGKPKPEQMDILVQHLPTLAVIVVPIKCKKCEKPFTSYTVKKQIYCQNCKLALKKITSPLAEGTS